RGRRRVPSHPATVAVDPANSGGGRQRNHVANPVGPGLPSDDEGRSPCRGNGGRDHDGQVGPAKEACVREAPCDRFDARGGGLKRDVIYPDSGEDPGIVAGHAPKLSSRVVVLHGAILNVIGPIRDAPAPYKPRTTGVLIPNQSPPPSRQPLRLTKEIRMRLRLWLGSGAIALSIVSVLAMPGSIAAATTASATTTINATAEITTTTCTDGHWPAA